MKKLLITGSTGFVGKALCESLKDTELAINLAYRNNKPLLSENIELNSKISVDQAANYDGQAILLLIDLKVGLGDGFSFATFAGEDASSVIIATTPPSFSSALASHGSNSFEKLLT